MNPLISIIIACKGVDNYVRECIKYCKKIDYNNYEIILLPDEALEDINGVKIIPTGPVTPGRKRNIGVSNAKGEYCAFIDSDAYPNRDWLKNAIKYFGDPMIAGIGGPGLTPEDDSPMRKASGYVLSSFMVGGLSRRYKAEQIYESDDIHSCNFIVCKKVLEEAGGWNEKYWPGEDTLICLSIRQLGKRLIEASDVVVHHHRRPLFKEHLKQVSRFGLHRGFFAKKFKGNSFKPIYFIPSLFVVSLFVGTLASLISPFLMNAVLLATLLYLLLCLFATLYVKSAKLFIPVWLGIVMTHIVYGESFLQGLIKRILER